MKSKLLLLITGLIGLTLFIYSCRKESGIVTGDLKTDSKTWFEKTYNRTLAKNMSAKGAAQKSYWYQFLSPDWEKAWQVNNEQREVLEIPLLDKSKIAAALGDHSREIYNPARKMSATSFLVLKEDGQFKAFVRTVIADSSYVGNDYSRPEKNTYKNMQPDFAGWVM